jgi:hypothetical protein
MGSGEVKSVRTKNCYAQNNDVEQSKSTKLSYIIMKYPLPSSQKAHFFPIIKIKPIFMFTQIIVVYSENYLSLMLNELERI